MSEIQIRVGVPSQMPAQNWGMLSGTAVTWRIDTPETTIADNTSPDGWDVTSDGAVDSEMVVTAPILGTGFTVWYHTDTSGPDGQNYKNSIFDVVEGSCPVPPAPVFNSAIPTLGIDGNTPGILLSGT